MCQIVLLLVDSSQIHPGDGRGPPRSKTSSSAEEARVQAGSLDPRRLTADGISDLRSYAVMGTSNQPMKSTNPKRDGDGFRQNSPSRQTAELVAWIEAAEGGMADFTNCTVHVSFLAE